MTTLVQMAAAIRRGSLLIMIGAVLGACTGWLVLETRTPTYRASASLVTSAADVAMDPGSLNQSSYTQWRIPEYDALLHSSSFLSRVVEERRLGLSAEELSGRIETSSPKKTAILTISATAPSAEFAAALANAVAQTATEVIPEREKGLEYRAVVASAALPPGQPHDPPASLVLSQYTYVGLALGLAAAVLRHRPR